MGRGPGQAMKRRCWGRRAAVVIGGGSLIALTTFLRLELSLLLAGIVGMLIAAFTYRFSRGYRSGVIGILITISTCLVTGVWVGLSHRMVCKVIQLVAAQNSIPDCAPHHTKAIVFGGLSLMIIGALIVAFTVGKYIVPVCSDSRIDSSEGSSR